MSSLIIGGAIIVAQSIKSGSFDALDGSRVSSQDSSQHVEETGITEEIREDDSLPSSSFQPLVVTDLDMYYSKASENLADCCDIPSETLTFFLTKRNIAQQSFTENTEWLKTAKTADATVCVLEWNKLLTDTQKLINEAQNLVDVVSINNAGAEEIKSQARSYINSIQNKTYPNKALLENFINTSIVRLDSFTVDVNTAADQFNTALTTRDSSGENLKTCLSSYLQ